MKPVVIKDFEYRPDCLPDVIMHRLATTYVQQLVWDGTVVPICDSLIQECGDKLHTRTWREIVFPRRYTRQY